MPRLVLCSFFVLAAIAGQCQQLIFPSDSLDQKVVKGFVLEGNKVTKQRIILREVPFAVGDTLSVVQLEAECEKARKNIFNTHLFNFVEVEPVFTENENVFIKISVIERWYWWPLPIFENADPNFNTWWKTRDFGRTNYGLIIHKQNFRGRNEDLFLKAKFGYTKEFQLTYNIPYINNEQTLGLRLSGLYKEQDEVTFATFDNERVFYEREGDVARWEQIYNAELSYRKGIYVTHSPKISFVNSSIRDSLALMAPDYFGERKKKLRYLKLSYFYTADRRDIRAYPLEGSYLQVGIDKRGLGLLSPKSLDLLSATMRYKKYWKLYHRLYFASGITTKININEDVPYYIQNGLGYYDFVRGYEYYIIDGQHYGLFKSNLKFELVPNKVIDLGFGPDKFTKIYYAVYLNAFFDAGRVWDNKYHRVNPLANELMMSGGLGLDLVTYYDSVFRMEVAYNRYREFGFFLHFVQPI